MMKSKTKAALILAVIVAGCSYYRPPSNTTIKQRDPELITPKTDDITWSVESGWRPGKPDAYQQSLHPNKVEKTHTQSTEQH